VFTFWSTFQSVDGMCGQASTWENEVSTMEGCKERAVIWGMSSEQYYGTSGYPFWEPLGSILFLELNDPSGT
jgi:hypothetical protein